MTRWINRLTTKSPLIALSIVFSCTSAFVAQDGKDADLCNFTPPKNFQKEIVRLKGITKNSPDLPGMTKAHLQLAMLYSHYKNPAPNYIKAVRELETYISLDPEAGKSGEIQNWLSILRKFKKIAVANKRMKDEDRKMKDTVIQLQNENKKLQETIEKLKHLDIKLEEKREKIKQ